MDMLEYHIKCLDMVRDSLRPRNLAPSPAEPVSDCCNAAMERVGDDLYTCSACGRLCSDGSLSI